MNRLLIRNGTIVTATDIYKADVFVEGEKVRAIGIDLKESAERTIDAAGCYLFPGGIDPHTHMELPFMGTYSSDTFESGTLAALHGGTTTIIDFAIQRKGDTLNSALNQWHEKADGKACGDYAFHVAVTDVNERTRKEVQEVIEKRGVNSFKTFMCYKGAFMVDDRDLIELIQELKIHGGLLTSHCENGELVDHLIRANLSKGNRAPKYHALSRPPICEEEATGRLIDLARALGDHPIYIVHMTCEEALNRVRLASLRNQKVLVETCIQYLVLDDSVYDRDGFEGSKFVMSPPIRKVKDQEALWAGINQNLVQTLATDHCPFCMNQKEMGQTDFSKIPNGAPGIENRLELLFDRGVRSGRISLNKFVDLCATASAKIFGLFPKKGTIAVGSDADIIVFDPNEEHELSAKTHHMNCDYSAYEGWKIRGKCRQTLLRGRVVIDEGKENIEKGLGQYLPRKRYNPNL